MGKKGGWKFDALDPTPTQNLLISLYAKKPQDRRGYIFPPVLPQISRFSFSEKSQNKILFSTPASCCQRRVLIDDITSATVTLVGPGEGRAIYLENHQTLLSQSSKGEEKEEVVYGLGDACLGWGQGWRSTKNFLINSCKKLKSKPTFHTPETIFFNCFYPLHTNNNSFTGHIEQFEL